MYNNLNQLNRALDIYNFSDNIPYLKRLESIRYLYNVQHKDRYRNQQPSQIELRHRLYNLAIEIYASQPNNQLIHELIDTAMEMNVTLPVVEEQKELFRQYTKPNKNDIFSLKTITQDRQNVHHTLINKNIRELIHKIMKDYPPDDGIWRFIRPELQKHKSWLDTNLESLKRIEDNHALKQPMLSVFSFIFHQPLELKEQLFQRLNEELDDMRGTCTTGHLTRLINVTQGLTTRYKLEIDPKKEIKKYVYEALTIHLKKAPEHIQEGVLECTDAYKKYLTDHSTSIEAHLGKDNRTMIQKCIDDFIHGRIS